MANQGLQIWDENGDLVVDDTTKLVLFLGVFVTTGAGSLSVPEFANGLPFVRSSSASGNFINDATWSGTTISWTAANQMILYGIY